MEHYILILLLFTVQILAFKMGYMLYEVVMLLISKIRWSTLIQIDLNLHTVVENTDFSIFRCTNNFGVTEGDRSNTFIVLLQSM
jgi:hypothetical protein